jgi:hypothetical protein
VTIQALKLRAGEAVELAWGAEVLHTEYLADQGLFIVLVQHEAESGTGASVQKLGPAASAIDKVMKSVG